MKCQDFHTYTPGHVLNKATKIEYFVVLACCYEYIIENKKYRIVSHVKLEITAAPLLAFELEELRL